MKTSNYRLKKAIKAIANQMNLGRLFAFNSNDYALNQDQMNQLIIECENYSTIDPSWSFSVDKNKIMFVIK